MQPPRVLGSPVNPSSQVHCPLWLIATQSALGEQLKSRQISGKLRINLIKLLELYEFVVLNDYINIIFQLK